MAKNMVIAGDYKGKKVMGFKVGAVISVGFIKSIPLNNTTIENYEVVTDEHRKSASSGVARGLVGGALLGPVGLLAGLSAKNKGTYTIVVKFKDGKESLMEVDDKVYKSLVRDCFQTS